MNISVEIVQDDTVDRHPAYCTKQVQTHFITLTYLYPIESVIYRPLSLSPNASAPRTSTARR